VVKVDTPYRDFLAFWARAEHAPLDEQVRLWDELYASRHPSLMAHYAGHFGEAASLEDSLARFGEVAPGLEATFEALALEHHATEVRRLLDVTQPLWAIALVGLFTADAWCDDLDGEPVAFFALEQVGCADTSAVHELAHAGHRLARAEYWDDVPGLALLGEGVTTTLTRRLCPHRPLEAHFVVDDFAAYEARADAAWSFTIDELLACLDSRDPRASQRFFWPDWGREDRDVPERVGYLIAARVMERLLGEHALTEIVRWPAERALREVRAALEAVR
jgi:hypothetical protein